MQMRQDQRGNNKELLSYLLILTGFYLLLEISFFIQCNKAYLFDFNFISDHLQIPSTIYPGLAQFVFVQLSLHLLYAVLIYQNVVVFLNTVPRFNPHKIFIAISAWIAGILFVLCANQLSFPNSKFSELTQLFIPDIAAECILIASAIVLLPLIILTAIISIKKLYDSGFIYSVVVLGILLTFAVIKPTFHFKVHDAATVSRPNIIIIGIDSLRPDSLSYFGSNNQTRFIDSFLNESSVFSEAVTPLARTFPSWTSILSGEYPKTNGVRFNLASQTLVNFDHSLPAVLRKNGYETVYATDETRFSNIDRNYEFDKIISPPVGLNDFLIGTFNDFPFSNLLVNTWIGKWLFPYSYGNRPVYFTYRPESFLNMVQSHLSTNRQKPLFLAIHFCLPHHPYIWSDLPEKNNSPIELYNASVARVDEQVARFFTLLQKSKLLDHAIVVLLSDHGEALELPGDRVTESELYVRKGLAFAKAPKFYPPSMDAEAIDESAGHGTDVLGLTQYHSLLAFRLYGTQQNQAPRLVNGVVSLLDVKPTILDLVNLKERIKTAFNTTANQEQLAGNSLMPSIMGKQDKINPKHIFMESDYSPESIRTVYPDTRKIVLDGIQLFQIDPITTRLTVKDSMGQMIIKSKQYADIYGEWILAFYPQNNHYQMPVLVNLKTGQWTTDLSSSFAKKSPANEMYQRLKQFYGHEIM